MKIFTQTSGCFTGTALLFAFLLIPLTTLAETNRITVEDPATGALKFKVTSDGNVTGASFSGAPTDGASISIRQGPTEANTAAKLQVIDAAGVVKMSASPNGTINVGSDAVSPGFFVTSATNLAGQAPGFTGRKGRGSLTTPQAVQNGDNLFTLSGIGYNGTGWPYASTAIVMPARETFTTTANGADIAFLTTAPGTTSRSEKFRVTGEGRVGIGTSTPTQLIDVNGNGIRIRTSRTPASSTAACNQGDVAWDANYVYVCVATNSWKRAGLASW